MATFLVFMAAESQAAVMKDLPIQLPHGAGQCIMANCSKYATTCITDLRCIEAMICNTKCQLSKNVDACNYVCELNYGYNSTKYRGLMQCMAAHGCLPKMKPDGVCLATDNDAIRNLTAIEQIKGKWWILKGLNCGQEGWPAGFDYFPCQRDEFVLEGSKWIDHTAYCGGKNNTCTTPMFYTKANVSMMSPGVMTHWYLDTPLLPQIEHWRVLSWPHPEWMLYIYCGETPASLYAGGSVVSNSSRSISNIPPYVEDIFSSVAEKFKFSYKEMCINDASKCTD